MKDVRCAACHREFGSHDQVACIAGRIFGDECTDIYYWCESCAVYTLRLCRDTFCGPAADGASAVIAKEEGDRRVALIRSCADPGDERCRCASHRAYFGECLD